MIQITAYLRDEEDLALWKAIGNKTAFLHDSLHVQNSTSHGTMYPKGETKPASGATVIVNDAEITERVKEIDEKFNKPLQEAAEAHADKIMERVIKTPKDVPDFDRQPIPKSFTARKKK